MSFSFPLMVLRQWQALDYPAQRGELLRQLFTDVALEVDSRAQGRKALYTIVRLCKRYNMKRDVSTLFVLITFFPQLSLF